MILRSSQIKLIKETDHDSESSSVSPELSYQEKKKNLLLQSSLTESFFFEDVLPSMIIHY
jgi:hypothetical protein